MSKGRLTNTEKYIIKGMLSDGKDAAEIAKELKRTEKTVTNYMNGELDGILKTVAKVHLKEAEQAEVESNEMEKDITNSDVISSVIRQLERAGLSSIDAERVMNATLNYAEKIGRKYFGDKGINKLYTDCVGRMPASSFMIKKTAGGREGVAIMTPGASQKTDHAKTKRKKTTRSTRGHIYDIKNNRMINDE